MKAKLYSNMGTSFTVPEPFANGLAEFPEDSYVVLGASFSRAYAYCGTLQKCEGS